MYVNGMEKGNMLREFIGDLKRFHSGLNWRRCVVSKGTLLHDLLHFEISVMMIMTGISVHNIRLEETIRLIRLDFEF